MRHPLATVAAGVAGSGLLAAVLVAQNAEVRPAQRLRSRVESVLVDVYPTRDGRAPGSRRTAG
jgi:hypothetical protein